MSAEPGFRMRPDDIQSVYVRSRGGEMVPLSSLVTVRYTSGPDSLDRFNNLPSVKIIGQAAPGVSSGQAIARVEQIAAEVLPADFSFDWGGTSYQEKRSGGASTFALVLAVIMVFLILAAQYERWSLPLSVLFALPFGTFGALAAVWLRGMTNDVYFQIGLVTLLGLAAKNAILIVEFAVLKVEEGLSPGAAAVEAARLRFRPILMTSLAFILGVLPLAISTGAGAGARLSVGTGVMGGMLAATFLAIFFVPLFFKVIFERRLFERRTKAELLSEVDHAHAHAHRVPQTPGHPPVGIRTCVNQPSIIASATSLPPLRSSSSLPAARQRLIAPPVLELPAPTMAPPPGDRTLVDAVRRRCAESAGRRSTRQQPRPAARDDAHRTGARERPARALRPVSVGESGGRRRAQPHQRGRLAADRRGIDPVSSNHRVGIAASYELDLWGKYRASTQAAQRTLLATQFARETVRTACRRRSGPSLLRAACGRRGARAPSQHAEHANRVGLAATRSLRRRRRSAHSICGRPRRSAPRSWATSRAPNERARFSNRRSPRWSGARRATSSRPSSSGKPTTSACSRSPRSRQACRRDCSIAGPTCAAWRPSSPPRTCASMSRGPITFRRSRSLRCSDPNRRR